MSTTLINKLKKKFGHVSKYKTDEELYEDMEKDVPSLVKLLKMTVNTNVK